MAASIMHAAAEPEARSHPHVNGAYLHKWHSTRRSMPCRWTAAFHKCCDYGDARMNNSWEINNTGRKKCSHGTRPLHTSDLTKRWRGPAADHDSSLTAPISTQCNIYSAKKLTLSVHNSAASSAVKAPRWCATDWDHSQMTSPCGERSLHSSGARPWPVRTMMSILALAMYVYIDHTCRRPLVVPPAKRATHNLLLCLPGRFSSAAEQ